MEISLAISITAIVFTILNFAFARKDKAIKDTKENHQELIEYQLGELKENYKSIANDIKDIKKMLDTYKETFKSIVKEEMEEHVKIYHNKEK